MSGAPEVVLQALRDATWARVADAARDRVEALDAAIDDLRRCDRDVADATAAAVRLAHALAGSAGVFGFRAEARAAAALEALLRAWPGSDGPELAAPHLAVLRAGFTRGGAST